MVLDVDIHQVRRELAEGVRAVRFAAEHEVGRLVDEAEIGLADGFEVGEDLIDRLKDRRGVALVREANAAIRCLLGRLACMRQVVIGFQTHADQVASQRLGNVQARSDVAQTIGTVGVVQWHIGIRRNHRHV